MTSRLKKVPKLPENEVAQRLGGRRALLLGGTKGIGFAFAKAFVRRGCNVSIVGRSDATDLVKELQALVPEGSTVEIDSFRADLSMVKSAVEFTQQFTAKHVSLDFSIATTGILPPSAYEETSEGLERDWSISFFSRFVILHEMLDYLRRAAAANARRPRVILFGVYGLNAKIDLEDLMSKQSFGALKVLQNCHLANEMLILQMATRAPEIDFFGFSPGFVASEAYTTWGGFKAKVATGLVSLFGKSCDTYVQGVLQAVCSPLLEKQPRPDLFFDNDCKLQKVSANLLDQEYCDSLYQRCVDLFTSTKAKAGLEPSIESKEKKDKGTDNKGEEEEKKETEAVGEKKDQPAAAKNDENKL